MLFIYLFICLLLIYIIYLLEILFILKVFSLFLECSFISQTKRPFVFFILTFY